MTESKPRVFYIFTPRAWIGGAHAGTAFVTPSAAEAYLRHSKSDVVTQKIDGKYVRLVPEITWHELTCSRLNTKNNETER